MSTGILQNSKEYRLNCGMLEALTLQFPEAQSWFRLAYHALDKVPSFRTHAHGSEALDATGSARLDSQEELLHLD